MSRHNIFHEFCTQFEVDLKDIHTGGSNDDSNTSEHGDN